MVGLWADTHTQIYPPTHTKHIYRAGLLICWTLWSSSPDRPRPVGETQLAADVLLLNHPWTPFQIPVDSQYWFEAFLPAPQFSQTPSCPLSMLFFFNLCCLILSFPKEIQHKHPFFFHPFFYLFIFTKSGAMEEERGAEKTWHESNQVTVVTGVGESTVMQRDKGGKKEEDSASVIALVP